MIDACAIETAFGIDRAFSPTIWRYAQKAWYARAHRMIVDLMTITVQTARRRETWMTSWYRQISFSHLEW